MKKIIVGLLMFIPLQIISGQDKIITIQQDTIHCRIISISPTHIQYEQTTENGYMAGKLIPTEQVSEYLRSPQSAEISLYDYTGSQTPKPVRKHYLGFGLTKGVNKYSGTWKSNWDQDYTGAGFEYAYRLYDSEIGVGLNYSTIYLSVPITLKKYLGEYIFWGFGLIAACEQKDVLCAGAFLMAGVEYVLENGFSLSFTPSFRYSLMNLTYSRKNKNAYGITNSGIDILQHAVVSIGIGYRF